jgi:uncharacterized membrane protein YdjX (TVP38/TMEM64 family)
MRLPTIGPQARLGLLAAAVAFGLIAFWAFEFVGIDDVRRWIEPAGTLAPIAYVGIAGLLGVLLVPGAVLAGVSGVLFGVWPGVAATLGAALVSAVIGLRLGRAAAGRSVEEVARGRSAGAARAVRENGLVAVIIQRLAPGVSDGGSNYAFGALRIRTWEIVLGTVIGTTPRALSYTALGASIDNPSSTTAILGAAGLVLTALVGAELVRRVARRRPRTPG